MKHRSWKWTLCVVGSICGWFSPMTIPSAYASTPASEPTVEVDLFDTGMSPTNIRAKENAPIHLHIVNKGHSQHQFSIPEFYIFTRTLAPGEVSDVEFSPYKLGAFEMSSDPVAADSPEYRGHFRVHS